MLLLGMGMFTMMSCDEIDECVSNEEAVILSSEMVDTATVNQAVDVKVEFDVMNGCGGYGGSDITTNGNTVGVVVRAEYIGCVCTEAIERIEETLSYTPTAAGTYVFEFEQDNIVRHRDTLVVQ